jgi:hypothetical protein
MVRARGFDPVAPNNKVQKSECFIWCHADNREVRDLDERHLENSDREFQHGDSTTCTGINNPGEKVGQTFTLDNFRSFLKIGSDLDFFEPAGSPDDHVNGVNGRGDVVGSSPSRGGGYLILNPEANEGTNDSEPTLKRIPISFPGATDTIPRGINYSRSIVGSYIDSSGQEHGFLAVPQ